MSLNILRKETVDETMVKDINELSIHEDHNKSVVNLFEVPLMNVSENEHNSETIFHGINVSPEKYSPSIDKLSNFISEIRENTRIPNEKENIMENKFVVEQNIQTCLEGNNIISSFNNKTNLSEGNKKNFSGFHHENNGATIEVKEICENAKYSEELIPLKINEKILPTLKNIALSPIRSASNNMIYASTPTFIHLKKINNDNKCLSGKTNHLNSTEPYKFDKLKYNSNISDQDDKYSELHIMDNDLIELPSNNECDKYLQDNPYNEKNDDLKVDNDQFISKIMRISDISNGSGLKPTENPYSKRELFVSDDEFNNNNHEKIHLSQETASSQESEKNSLTFSKLDIDIKQLICLDDDDDVSFLECVNDNFEDRTKYLSNMSIDTEYLENSLLNMSVDDNEIKHFELCKSANKKCLDVIEECENVKEDDIMVNKIQGEDITENEVEFIAEIEGKDLRQNEKVVLKEMEDNKIALKKDMQNSEIAVNKEAKANEIWVDKEVRVSKISEDKKVKDNEILVDKEENLKEIVVDKEIKANENAISKDVKVQSEILLTEEIKSYQVPFVSSNQEENDDNNNNKWNYLKSLETDEERYKVVRSVWKNMLIPDPNMNLSCFNFYHKSKKFTLNCGNEEITVTRKRQREETSSQEPNAKRCKIFNNVNFFKRKLYDTKVIVERNFQRDEYRLRSNYRCANHLRERFYEKMNQLDVAENEVEAIHKFYKGLPNQIQHDQRNVEREQDNIDKLYSQFCQIYKWSGRAFSHSIII